MSRVLIIALFIALFLLTPNPADAQATWSYYCDFTQAPGDWVSGLYYSVGLHQTVTIDAAWVDGSGWHGVNTSLPKYTFIRHLISPAAYTITEIGFTTSGASGNTARLDNDSDRLSLLYELPGGVPNYWKNNLIWSGGSEIELISSVNFGSSPYIRSVSVAGTGTNPFGMENCIAEPPPQLTRPLSIDDEHDAYQIFDNSGALDWGQYYHDNLAGTDPLFPGYWFFPGLNTFNHFGVYGISNTPGQKVHAAWNGTVESVVPLNPASCAIGIADANLEGPYTIILDSPDCIAPLPVLGDTLGRHDVISYPTTNVYIVTIALDDYDLTLSYVVTNANLYVQTGDNVLAGCVLGETVGYISNPGLEASISLSFGPISVSTNVVSDQVFAQGFTLVQAYDSTSGDPVALLQMLSVYPDTDGPCGGSGEFADCLTGNPGLTANGDGWTATEYVQWLNPGALLAPQSILYQFLALNTETTSYTMTLQAKSTGGTGTLRLFGGYNNETPTILDEWSTYSVIIPQSSEPDSGLEFTVGIENTGSTSIEVNYICVTEGDAAIDPGVCIFPMNTDWVNDWSGGGGAVIDTAQFLLGDGATISQSLTLTEAGDYRITVLTSLWSESSLWNLGGESQIALKWTFGALPQETFTPNPGVWQAFSSSGALNYSDTLTLAAAATETMTITVDIVNAPATTKGLAIEGVCISLEPEGGTIDPPLTATCKVVTRPTTADLWRWIEYHWQQLDRFFHCELMIYLNRLYDMLNGWRLTAAWAVRWGQSSIHLGSQWMGKQLFPWLNGHFRNMAFGQVTTIDQSGGIGLWDVLLALINGVFAPITGALTQIVGLLIGLITQIANLLLSVITGAITLVLAIITQALNLLMTGQQMLGSIVTAYNTADPTAIPGLPTCIDPKSHLLCTGVWVLDNTIFSGPGTALIPLVIAIFSILLVLWIVGEIKRTIVGVGQNS